MIDFQNEETKKTIVTFAAGLLIGGLLVWAFSGGKKAEAPTITADKNAEVTTPASQIKTAEDNARPAAKETVTSNLVVDEGLVVVENQPAGNQVVLVSATYPIPEGWIGIREYTNEKIGKILGVVRFSESQKLIPTTIILQRPTQIGKTYAVTIFNQNGDHQFDFREDTQIDKIFATFTAE